MEIAFPDRVHDHQHNALDNAVSQGWDTQGSQLTIGFPDIDAPDRLWTICPLQQALLQLIQVVSQIDLHLVLIYSINARCTSAT